MQSCTLKNKQPVKSDGIVRASIAELHVAADESRRIPAAATDRVVRFTDDRGLGALTGLVRLEFKAMGAFSATIQAANRPRPCFRC